MIFTTTLGGGQSLLFFLLVRKLRLREVKEFISHTVVEPARLQSLIAYRYHSLKRM